ncbi:MAG: prepilin-type N-terminal cleavage/methylation domain-containing protein [Verrucomicrobia bacterium]|nr:prepilin-type N-terminal cleavage/methylation domain-containing protein [Verrucomicrobiota bacterium]
MRTGGDARNGVRHAARTKLQSQDAFTLVEIMIAIAIFAGVMAAIYSSWSGIVRGSKAALNAATEAQRARMAMRVLEESLTSAELFMQNVRHYAFLADTSDEFAALSFVARLGSSFPGSGLFGEQVVRRVTFQVESQSSGPPHLVMIQTPLLAPPDSDKDSYPLVLAGNVKQFKLMFWDFRRNEWLEEWTLTNQLPRAVQVLLEFGEPNRHGSRADNLFSKTFSLPAIAVPLGYQVPGVAGGPPGAGQGQPGVPPGQGAPGRVPTGQYPQGQYPPGQFPSGGFPRTQLPAGQFQPLQPPYGQPQPGQFPGNNFNRRGRR